jgi:hypothetical protein
VARGGPVRRTGGRIGRGRIEDPALDRFFAGHDRSRRLFDALLVTARTLGPVELRVTKSQVAFRRERPFAYAWIPARYLSGVHPPLVLTVPLRRRDPSPRWKQVVQPRPGRYAHHLELRSTDQIDQQVRDWLAEAWAQAR